ncbi:predicted protein [Verticillium alfalfae VaMs.102]|uniref:Predicted protein n=1 Tax=Verticillium alfalfae (strain VaMs.102 / ATCC MYA-4576 / FGSC 10136) TaxID=526221 RepID=C9SM86_VERA1|nr:predicted protein [Verticillium alfalfae VaMs.102]EEY19901.1 predicted protein [Verticillium alfalfae VaMs.102]
MFRVDVAAGRGSGTKSMSQSKLDRTKFSGPSHGRDHGNDRHGRPPSPPGGTFRVENSGQRSKVLDGFSLKKTQTKGPREKNLLSLSASCAMLRSRQRAPVIKGRQLGFWVTVLLGRDGNMLDCVVAADVWLRRLIPRRTTP